MGFIVPRWLFYMPCVVLLWCSYVLSLILSDPADFKWLVYVGGPVPTPTRQPINPSPRACCQGHPLSRGLCARVADARIVVDARFLAPVPCVCAHAPPSYLPP